MKQPAKPAAFLIDKDLCFESLSMYLCGVVWCVQHSIARIHKALVAITAIVYNNKQ
ncbi:hypothetical protein M2105_001197 [Paenibacillus sp. PastF-1]|nr:hypothetical protein [Paenibacillus sp. PastF-2]MDF9846295.1 hypothetical protein [Paenibacillus sp. PastM-2]MDF9853355.1 hypothetical protein [Paenibacillus sp. PastF-1]MDH6478141.1 hypothetical protein [Paenibacillus sp. PastH-2]MDH6506360.1 hypothetical protein [Paenibacillus sp. PastM-3]